MTCSRSHLEEYPCIVINNIRCRSVCCRLPTGELHSTQNTFFEEINTHIMRFHSVFPFIERCRRCHSEAIARRKGIITRDPMTADLSKGSCIWSTGHHRKSRAIPVLLRNYYSTGSVILLPPSYVYVCACRVLQFVYYAANTKIFGW